MVGLQTPVWRDLESGRRIHETIMVTIMGTIVGANKSALRGSKRFHISEIVFSAAGYEPEGREFESLRGAISSSKQAVPKAAMQSGRRDVWEFATRKKPKNQRVQKMPRVKCASACQF